MNAKKKKVLYIVLACILIVAGLWIDRNQEQAEKPQTGTESVVNAEEYISYYFRNDDLLEQHYEKHGMDMGFDSMEEYEEAASAVIYHPEVLTKTEAEDGDYGYYIEESNEFVALSLDGYNSTYFNPDDGIEYFNRQ